MRKYTLEYIKIEYLKNNIEFMDAIYINSKHSHNLKCMQCNYLWTSCFERLKQGKQCPNCIKIKQTNKRRISLEEVKKRCLINNIEFLENEYKNNSTPYYVLCLKCEHKWKLRFNDIGKYGCPKCGIENTKNKLKLSFEFVVNKYLEKNIEFVDEKYTKSLNNHKLMCLVCNHIFYNCYNNFSRRGDGCPKCSQSKNEKLTIKYLKKLFNISISCKKIEMNCDFQKHCIVDAYFEYKDKKIIIEYNGEQHYRVVTFGGKNNLKLAQKRFKRQVKRDEWLRNYCKINDIILIEIDGRKYTDIKIEKYLIEQLKILQLI